MQMIMLTMFFMRKFWIVAEKMMRAIDQWKVFWHTKENYSRFGGTKEKQWQGQFDQWNFFDNNNDSDSKCDNEVE